MRSLELVQLTYSLYTMMILQKYIGDVLRRLRSLEIKIHAEDQQLEEKEVAKKERNSYLAQIKQWVVASTGIAAVYLTGSMQYVLPLLNVVITVFTNLPGFTRIGAPLLCITLKLYGFKFKFLRGWFIVTLINIVGAIFASVGSLPDAASYTFAFFSSLQVFAIYHLEIEEIYNGLLWLQKRIMSIDYADIFYNVVDEIITNG